MREEKALKLDFLLWKKESYKEKVTDYSRFQPL